MIVVNCDGCNKKETLKDGATEGTAIRCISIVLEKVYKGSLVWSAPPKVMIVAELCESCFIDLANRANPKAWPKLKEDE